MKYLEYTLFPTLVMVFKYEKDFSKEFEYIKNIKYTDTISSNKYLLYEPELKNLKQFFHEAISFYMQEKFKSNQKVAISQSWSTALEKGQGFDEHDHPNSLINGCFYFNTTKNSSPLKLIKVGQQTLYPQMSSLSEYNMGRFDVHTGPGQLVLFPNTLHHMVNKSTENETRRSLAFNTFMLDKLGSEELMTEVNIEKIKNNNK